MHLEEYYSVFQKEGNSGTYHNMDKTWDSASEIN